MRYYVTDFELVIITIINIVRVNDLRSFLHRKKCMHDSIRFDGLTRVKRLYTVRRKVDSA